MPNSKQANAYLDALVKAATPPGQKGDWFHVSDASPSMLGQGYDKDKHIIIVSQPEYAPGDDVTFRGANGGLVLHRVTYVKPGFVFTKGTFNRNGDGWIPLKDVVGKVTRAISRKELDDAVAAPAIGSTPPAPATIATP